MSVLGMQMIIIIKSIFCPQSQSRAEEGNGPVQEAGAGWPTAGPENQRQLCLRLHGGPGGEAALP